MSQFSKIYGYILFVFFLILYFVVTLTTPPQNKVKQKKIDTLVVDTTLKK